MRTQRSDPDPAPSYSTLLCQPPGWASSEWNPPTTTTAAPPPPVQKSITVSRGSSAALTPANATKKSPLHGCYRCRCPTTRMSERRGGMEDVGPEEIKEAGGEAMEVTGGGALIQSNVSD